MLSLSSISDLARDEPLKLAFGIVLLISSYVLSFIIYRLKFHPLAKYPSPFIGRLTDWYSVYHAILKDRHIDFYRLHQKYGDIVRYGPNRISICTSTGLKAIYGTNAAAQKARFYKIFGLAFTIPNTLSMIDKNRHAFHRRVLMQSLSGTALKGMEEHILRNSMILCEMLVQGAEEGEGDRDRDGKREGEGEGKEGENGWSSPKNMTGWCSRVTFDVMGDILFGQNWSVLTSATNRGLPAAFRNGAGALSITSHMPWLLHLKLDWTFFRARIDGVLTFRAVSDAKAKQRIAEGSPSGEPDIFASLLNAKDPETGQGFTTEELVSEGGLMIVAGADTTSTCLAAILFYLLHNAPTLAHLTHELRSTFPNLEAIRPSNPALATCTYLSACITEALRLAPPASGIMPREAGAQGIWVDGEFFGAGTWRENIMEGKRKADDIVFFRGIQEVGTPIYALQHLERYVEDSFAFRPERWIVDEGEGEGRGEEDVKRVREAWCPFIIGPRSCAGRTLAIMEMEIVLGRLIWGLEMRLAPGMKHIGGGGGKPGLTGGSGREREGEFQTWDAIVSLSEGPWVEFRRRRRGDA